MLLYFAHGGKKRKKKRLKEKVAFRVLPSDHTSKRSYVIYCHGRIARRWFSSKAGEVKPEVVVKQLIDEPGVLILFNYIG